MHRSVVPILFVIVILSACATATKPPLMPTVTPEPTSTPKPDCAADTPPDFADYAAWTKVNPAPIKGHEVYVNIFVNDLAKDIYLSASGETLPICSMIVKTHLESANSENITAISVMVKMHPGYDPDNNDWWWGMYDRDGKVAEMTGKVPVCIACHKPAASTDYVFSQKVMEESAQ